MFKSKKNDGFTIVELVIIIAIIAILAAVLIPTFSNVIKKANETASLKEAKSKFNEFYAIDYADGTADGCQYGVPMYETDEESADKGKITLAGFENCKYDATDGSFTYTNSKYLCTTKITIEDGENTWDIQPLASPTAPSPSST